MLGEAAGLRGGHTEQAGGLVRLEVGGAARLGEDAVDALRRPDVLTQLRQCLVGGHQRVQRVEARMGHGRGMG